jgi:hypothetical protein
MVIINSVVPKAIVFAIVFHFLLVLRHLVFSVTKTGPKFPSFSVFFRFQLACYFEKAIQVCLRPS